MKGPLFLVAGLLAGLRTQGVETWTDPRLPVTNGVVAWYDASRQTAARGARGLAPLRSWADAPEIVFDGSGGGRHVAQSLREARPTFRIDWGTSALAFDGTNDHLVALHPGWTLREASVFVVAAPQEVGAFRGLLAASAMGRNDYITGFNLDFGSPASTNQLAVLNAEGPGFGGERNLLQTSPQPLDRWHVFGLGVGSNSVRAFLDGAPQAARPRTSDQPLAADEVTLGARRYSNTPDRPHAQGFFRGRVTEVLIYDRVLQDTERVAVEHYLDEKYGSVLRGLGQASPREGPSALVPVPNPPPVQVHFPGVAAEPLPLDLGNVNNVRYRADGGLVAVGYDGRIWHLRDRDGDGREDAAALFFDGRASVRAPVGAALTPSGYARGNGLFVAAKGRLALVVDTDGDDRADADITVATWTETSIQQGVDALGVAVAPDGSVYFSLGCASFVEPFLIDSATGQAGYHTRRERGTILRVSPDFSRREIVATGIRFAVGMAFHADGELFVTDQEGATWRHDGNPLDELLHIQPGRHYGFPPRHPKHLPGVFDEPSVFDYVPQHQSTCGLCFNSAAVAVGAGAGTQAWFGPAHWRGDALVAGYSRGKVWRTKLVRTEAGYVAQTHLLATLQALVVDVCVSPRGDLLVATHSGQPDWGSGPAGQGRLWRLRYAQHEVPQPVTAWLATPTEIKIAFDRPAPPGGWAALASHARIESGPAVFPGDRFETLRPGYQVVYDQLAAPRQSHEILTTQLSPDQRTLTLVTRPREAPANTAVTLPASQASRAPSPQGADSLKPVGTTNSPIAGEIDLLATAHGLDAVWSAAQGNERLQIWLPHPDLKIANELTRGSADHARFFEALGRPGKLRLRGQLDLWQMLQPAIQPGSAIDWVRPPENVRVRFTASAELELRVDAPHAAVVRVASTPRQSEVRIDAPGRAWARLELVVATGPNLALTADWCTDEDARARAFPLRRFYVPWAALVPAAGVETAGNPRVIPEIAGGNWLHGRRLFFGDRLGCAKCHAIRGEGARLGPELSNLLHRDYASVRQDIESPNAAINPDHVASILERTDGEALTGIVLSEKDGALRLATAAGTIEELPRNTVRAARPSTLSLMPEGLWAGLTEAERRDLMTFLLTNPIEPAPVALETQGPPRPPPRKLSEVAACLGAAAASRPGLGAGPAAGRSRAVAETNPAPWRIVLCASAKDRGHGAPGFHDYPLWRERWATLLALADAVEIETADRWPSAEQWQRADVIAFYHDNPAWIAAKAADVDAFLERGGGLVFLHWSMNAYQGVDALIPRLWRAWGPGAKFRYGLEDLALASHPITAGFPATLRLTDEAYWNLPGGGGGGDGGGTAAVLASSREDGELTPQVWLREQGRGRVFVCIPGHFTWTFDDPLFRIMVLRGLAWAGKQPLERLEELATVGARFEP
jgi:putative heme-binding domain-containing protein